MYVLFQSYHAELHQYKHHIELFNQLTQKLIAVYQQDDTTKVKKMTETINQRYNNLNTRWEVVVFTLYNKNFITLLFSLPAPDICLEICNPVGSPVCIAASPYLSPRNNSKTAERILWNLDDPLQFWFKSRGDFNSHFM